MVGESGGSGHQQQQQQHHGISPHRGESQQGRGASGGGDREGDEVGLTRGNPYAVLLQATKIELLETHKNTAVAKRWVGCLASIYTCYYFLLLPLLVGVVLVSESVSSCFPCCRCCRGQSTNQPPPPPQKVIGSCACSCASVPSFRSSSLYDKTLFRVDIV